MKSSNEYIKEAKEYAERRLARIKEKFGNNYLRCDDDTAMYLIYEGYLEGIMRHDHDHWEKTERTIEKACSWLEANRVINRTPLGESTMFPKCFIESFKRAMLNENKE